jgi:hypothetical protein
MRVVLIFTAIVLSVGGPILYSKTAGRALSGEPPKPVRIDRGARVRVRAILAVSARTNRPGDSFTARLEEPLMADGRAVAPKGAEVVGVVAQADSTRVAVRLTEVKTKKGSLNIATTPVIEHALLTRMDEIKTILLRVAAGAAIGAILMGGPGAAIGASAGGGAGAGLVSARRGKPPVLGSDKVLTFRVTTPVTVTSAT